MVITLVIIAYLCPRSAPSRPGNAGGGKQDGSANNHHGPWMGDRGGRGGQVRSRGRRQGEGRRGGLGGAGVREPVWGRRRRMGAAVCLSSDAMQRQRRPHQRRGKEKRQYPGVCWIGALLWVSGKGRSAFLRPALTTTMPQLAVMETRTLSCPLPPFALPPVNPPNRPPLWVGGGRARGEGGEGGNKRGGEAGVCLGVLGTPCGSDNDKTS